MSVFFKTAYGVEMTGRGALFVRGVRGARGIQLDAARDGTPPAAEDAAVAAAMPTHESFLRRIVAPFPSVAKARKVFASILDIQLPFPIERCECRFLQAEPTAGGQVEALAVAARNEDLEARIGRLREAGLDPTHLDIEALALWSRSLEEAPLDLATPRVVLYVGPAHSALVLGRGGRCLAAHAVRTGAKALFEDGGLAALAVRARQAVQAQWKDEASGPMQWALCGPGFEEPGRADAIKAALERHENAQFFQHKEPVSFLARALAWRALEPGPCGCNLLEGGFEHPRLAAVRDRAFRRAAAAALAAGLALCVLNLGWRGALAAKKERAQDRLAALAAELSGLPKVPPGQELVVAERAVAERRGALQPVLGLLSAGPAGALASALEAASGRCTLDTATASAEAVVLGGRAASWEDADRVAEALRGAGWQVSVDHGEAGADERLPFTIRAVP